MGKSRSAEKKAALQAKKEAKAHKAEQKRAIKEDAEALDALLAQYQQQDEVSVPTVVDVPSFPPARANPSFTLDPTTGYIYLFGGEYFDGVQTVLLDQLWRYHRDSSSWQWIQTPIRPPGRCAHSMVYYQQALYLFGGEKTQGDSYYHYKDVWKFDLPTLLWTPIPTKKVGKVPSARSGHAAVVHQDVMVVLGGFYETKDMVQWYNDVYAFDLKALQWKNWTVSALSAQPEPRSNVNVGILNDRILVHGGFSKFDAATTLVHTDAWWLAGGWERCVSSVLRLTEKVRRESPTGRAATGSVVWKDQLLVMGGVVDREEMHHGLYSVFYNTVFAWKDKKWSYVAGDQDGWNLERLQGTSMQETKEPLPRISPSLIVQGDTLIAYGGLLEIGDREVTLDDMWTLDLNSKVWTCVYVGSMHKQVWRGEVDDDSSCMSTEQAGGEEESDEEEKEEEKEDIVEEVPKKDKKRLSRSKMKEEMIALSEQYHLDDLNRTPQPGEDADAFYTRTVTYWSAQADGDAEALARARFAELEPVLQKLQALHIARKEMKKKT